MKFRTLTRIFVSIFAFLLSICSFAQLPSVKIDNLKGEQISSLSLLEDGKPMIILFWACNKHCILELDAINENLPDWLEEADFKVVAVSTDDARFYARARSLAQDRGWEDFVHLYDKNLDLTRAMNARFTPQVFVLDAKGNIVYSHIGYEPGSEQELLDAIKGIE